MPCPFGYTARGNDEEEEEEKIIENVDKRGDTEGQDEHAKKMTSWFYHNQIKSGELAAEGAFWRGEVPSAWAAMQQAGGWNCRGARPAMPPPSPEDEFQAKRKVKQQLARGRLERIMEAKQKALSFDPDFDASIASSELSELDSDVHSLSSLKSCARSWMEDAEYKAPAEGWVKFAAPICGVAAGFCLCQAAAAGWQCSEALPTDTVLNPQWPAYCAGLASATAAAAAALYYSVQKRSKRLLLTGLVGLLVAHALSAWLIAAMRAHPTSISHRKLGPQDTFPALSWSCVAAGTGCVLLAGLGLWYVFELAYIEKKAAKHSQRHRRHRHKIPWHKIKIIGPVTNCGSGGGGPHARGRGKGKARSGGKCPMRMG